MDACILRAKAMHSNVQHWCTCDSSSVALEGGIPASHSQPSTQRLRGSLLSFGCIQTLMRRVFAFTFACMHVCGTCTVCDDDDDDDSCGPGACNARGPHGNSSETHTFRSTSGQGVYPAETSSYSIFGFFLQTLSGILHILVDVRPAAAAKCCGEPSKVESTPVKNDTGPAVLLKTSRPTYAVE